MGFSSTVSNEALKCLAYVQIPDCTNYCYASMMNTAYSMIAQPVHSLYDCTAVNGIPNKDRRFASPRPQRAALRNY
jgi:hypothetical protein